MSKETSRSIVQLFDDENAIFPDLNSEVKQEYEREFIVAYNHMVEGFVKIFDALCDEWIVSDAGTAWIAHLEKLK